MNKKNRCEGKSLKCQRNRVVNVWNLDFEMEMRNSRNLNIKVNRDVDCQEICA